MNVPPPKTAKVLISACLLGEAVRYDGGHRALRSPLLRRWLAEGRVVPVCPEVEGGLTVPRPPIELRDHDRAVDCLGHDRWEALRAGAHAALQLLRREGAVVAVLTELSPSCGSSEVYDGTFSGRRIPGSGLTTRLLRAAGIEVFSEHQLEAADQALRRADGGR